MKLYESLDIHLYVSHGTKPSKGGHPSLKTVNECTNTNKTISMGRIKDTSSRFFLLIVDIIELSAMIIYL